MRDATDLPAGRGSISPGLHRRHPPDRLNHPSTPVGNSGLRPLMAVAVSRRLRAIACLAPLLALSACAAPHDTATQRLRPPCSPATHLLLTATLSRLAPSRTFNVTAHTTAWASTSNRPDQDQLFDGAAGIADVSVITASAPVRTRVDERGTVLPTDRTVNLHTTGHWYRLPVTAGTWRLYTIDRGNPRQVTVIGCPHH